MGDFDEHLALAVGQFVKFGIRILPRRAGIGFFGTDTGETAVHHLLDKPFCGGWRDDRVALEHRSDRIQQRLRFRVFEQESGCAGVDGGHHVFIQIEGRQNDHPRAFRVM